MAQEVTGRAGLSVTHALNRLIARPDIQSRLARIPIANWFARRDGAELFSVVQGFVSSQVIMTLVDCDVFEHLADGPLSVRTLAARVQADPDRLQVFLQAGAALKLLRRKRDGRFALARRGAALRGVPGLADMIRHHTVLYRDLESPTRLLRSDAKTELSEFWPYVLSPDRIGATEAARYSHLMTESQRLVAEDTLAQVSFSGIRHLMDVGGGSGAFLSAVAHHLEDLHLTLFDLPQTRPAAEAFLSKARLQHRITCADGSFVSDPLPHGADAISLVRVLYDHADDTVRALLAKVHDALPPGGRVIVSEPMSGGARPDGITDVYFALYTMAMGTGRTRSAEEIDALLKEAGFTQVHSPRPRRSYITRVVVAQKTG